MGYKNIFVFLAAICMASACSCEVYAIDVFPTSDAPIQIHPARDEILSPAKIDSSKSPTVKPLQVKEKSKSQVKTKTISTKIQYTRYKKKKKKVVIIKPDYKQISKQIELGDYNDADRLIQKALSNNSKDIKALGLESISMAKQYKLDPAQKQLNTLLKTYPNNSDLHYAQGLIYYNRTTSSNMTYRGNASKLLQDAMSEFNKAVALDKNNYMAYNAIGVVNLNLGNQAEAKKMFQKAIAVNGSYSTAIDNLGTIYFAEGKFDDAEKKFKQALTYNPGNATAMYHLAKIADSKQDYSNALTYLNNALAINSDSAGIYNLMGEIYEKQGNEAAAITAYKKSVSNKPEFTVPYLNLADVYAQRGDGEFAIEQLKTALTIDPDFYNARLKIADIYLTNGKYNQAIENYSKLLDVEEYKNDALKGLASAYYEKAQIASAKALIGSNGEFFKAFDLINKAVNSNNEDLELHLAKLKLAKITNQSALSEKLMEEIIQSPKQDLISTVIKGEAYLILNNYKEAQRAFDLASKSTKSPQEDLYLAEIFVYHKQYTNAKAVLNKVLKTDPKNQQAISSLEYINKCEKYADNDFKSAQYFLKSGNTNAALDYLLRSLSVNPNNPQGYLLLGQIYEKQKKYKDAALNYKIYVGLEGNSDNKTKIQKKIIRLEKK